MESMCGFDGSWGCCDWVGVRSGWLGLEVLGARKGER